MFEEPDLEELHPLTEQEINQYLSSGIRAIRDEKGWAELASLGLFLIRRTPVNYRALGFPTLRRFIESLPLFEVKVIQKSSYAKKADTAYVRIREIIPTTASVSE